MPRRVGAKKVAVPKRCQYHSQFCPPPVDACCDRLPTPSNSGQIRANQSNRLQPFPQWPGMRRHGLTRTDTDCCIDGNCRGLTQGHHGAGASREYWLRAGHGHGWLGSCFEYGAGRAGSLRGARTKECIRAVKAIGQVGEDC